MAFVRWRGQCAQLLATVYDQGRSRQVLLTNLHSGYHVPNWTREDVEERFPQVHVDWEKVEKVLAKGPTGIPALEQEQWDYLRVEQALRVWAKDPTLLRSDAGVLRAAAQVLTNRRARIQVSVKEAP